MVNLIQDINAGELHIAPYQRCPTARQICQISSKKGTKRHGKKIPTFIKPYPNWKRNLPQPHVFCPHGRDRHYKRRLHRPKIHCFLRIEGKRRRWGSDSQRMYGPSQNRRLPRLPFGHRHFKFTGRCSIHRRRHPQARRHALSSPTPACMQGLI